MAPPRTPIIDRLNAKTVVDVNGCWIWTGAADPYGRIYDPDTDLLVLNHRFSYQHFVGDVPEGKQIHHVCENKRCWNPEHLLAVTPRENLMASNTQTRRNAEKTHCKHGHPFTEENTVWWRGGRGCRECNRSYSREYQRRRRMADVG